ncbi:MAG: hypothetical protein OXP09_17070 [Gammaproteobacteria bacterium]|nr:hypothetical protein [Gammaproteobacteria bacterium]
MDDEHLLDDYLLGRCFRVAEPVCALVDVSEIDEIETRIGPDRRCNALSHA